MSANDTFMYVKNLFSIALFFQCIEMISISKSDIFLKIWNFKNIENTFIKAIPLSPKIIFVLFSEKIFRRLLYAQLLFISISFLFFHPLVILVLALLQLIICMRFRGTFNGGSDMMTFVVAFGLIIGGNLGLIYIAIHSCYSYFKAGLVKVKNPEWRSGHALPSFLKASLFADVQTLGPQIQNRFLIKKFLSWLTLIFELSLPLIFIFPKVATTYLAAAVVFHFVVYLMFGLNRFFWIWLTTWPAILFTVHSIRF